MHQNIGCLFDPHTPLAGHGPNKVFFQPSVFWGWSLAIQKVQAPFGCTVRNPVQRAFCRRLEEKQSAQRRQAWAQKEQERVPRPEVQHISGFDRSVHSCPQQKINPQMILSMDVYGFPWLVGIFWNRAAKTRLRCMAHGIPSWRPMRCPVQMVSGQ